MPKIKNEKRNPTIKSVDTSYLQELLAQDNADMEALHGIIAEDEKRLSELFAMMDADNQLILENMAKLE